MGGGGEHTIETTFERFQGLDLTKTSKSYYTLNTFKEFKKIIPKESKESMITKSHGRENINKET